jgi:hypothetical protein
MEHLRGSLRDLLRVRIRKAPCPANIPQRFSKGFGEQKHPLIIPQPEEIMPFPKSLDSIFSPFPPALSGETREQPKSEILDEKKK